MNTPIIRLEIEGMRQTILAALTQHHVQLDTYIQSALEKYCSDDYIQGVVDASAKRALDEAIKGEVESFFRYGPGRAAVKAAIAERLKEYGSLD